RYEAMLADAGQHGQLPLAAFNALQRWGCTHECFANPFNATLSGYCSLFPETDAAFGSSGNFFGFWPKSGNFEVNPPFCVKSSEIEDHMFQLLSTAEERGEALSFCYVVPETADRKHRRATDLSRFLAHFAAWKEAHYRRGRDHEYALHRPYIAHFATAITFYQTSKAQAMWPVDEAL
ncbi:phosphorylated CTD interacting factor 1 WW domain-containing protein, partial [Pelagophyceae sp. CCMP2097]